MDCANVTSNNNTSNNNSKSFILKNPTRPFTPSPNNSYLLYSSNVNVNDNDTRGTDEESRTTPVWLLKTKRKILLQSNNNNNSLVEFKSRQQLPSLLSHSKKQQLNNESGEHSAKNRNYLPILDPSKPPPTRPIPTSIPVPTAGEESVPPPPPPTNHNFKRHRSYGKTNAKPEISDQNRKDEEVGGEDALVLLSTCQNDEDNFKLLANNNINNNNNSSATSTVIKEWFNSEATDPIVQRTLESYFLQSSKRDRISIDDSIVQDWFQHGLKFLLQRVLPALKSKKVDDNEVDDHESEDVSQGYLKRNSSDGRLIATPEWILINALGIHFNLNLVLNGEAQSDISGCSSPSLIMKWIKLINQVLNELSQRQIGKIIHFDLLLVCCKLLYQQLSFADDDEANISLDDNNLIQTLENISFWSSYILSSTASLPPHVDTSSLLAILFKSYNQAVRTSIIHSQHQLLEERIYLQENLGWLQQIFQAEAKFPVSDLLNYTARIYDTLAFLTESLASSSEASTVDGDFEALLEAAWNFEAPYDWLMSLDYNYNGTRKNRPDADRGEGTLAVVQSLTKIVRFQAHLAQSDWLRYHLQNTGKGTELSVKIVLDSFEFVIYCYEKISEHPEWFLTLLALLANVTCPVSSYLSMEQTNIKSTTSSPLSKFLSSSDENGSLLFQTLVCILINNHDSSINNNNSNENTNLYVHLEIQREVLRILSNLTFSQSSSSSCTTNICVFEDFSFWFKDWFISMLIQSLQEEELSLLDNHQEGESSGRYSEIVFYSLGMLLNATTNASPQLLDLIIRQLGGEITQGDATCCPLSVILGYLGTRRRVDDSQLMMTMLESLKLLLKLLINLAFSIGSTTSSNKVDSALFKDLIERVDIGAAINDIDDDEAIQLYHQLMNLL